MTFFIACDPPRSVSKNSKTIIRTPGGKPRVVTGKKTANDTADLLSLLAPYAPKEPMKGALKLEAYFYFPFPKSAPKAKRAMSNWPKSTRPDADGLLSGLLDAMQRLVFFEDDSQIWSVKAEKFESTKPGIAVVLKEAGL